MTQETVKTTTTVTRITFDTDDIERFLVEKYNLDESAEFCWNMTYSDVLEVRTKKETIEEV